MCKVYNDAWFVGCEFDWYVAEGQLCRLFWIHNVHIWIPSLHVVSSCGDSSWLCIWTSLSKCHKNRASAHCACFWCEAQVYVVMCKSIHTWYIWIHILFYELILCDASNLFQNKFCSHIENKNDLQFQHLHQLFLALNEHFGYDF